MSDPTVEKDHLSIDAEPGKLAARVIDRDGDIWASTGGITGRRWGCLTTASAPQTWSDLWHVCGPLTLQKGGW